jgi:hypothetical protein
VFGSERFQAEPVALEVYRDGELVGNERRGHPHNLGRAPRFRLGVTSVRQGGTDPNCRELVAFAS